MRNGQKSVAKRKRKRWHRDESRSRLAQGQLQFSETRLALEFATVQFCFLTTRTSAGASLGMRDGCISPAGESLEAGAQVDARSQ